jgi:hypothetical protein
MNARSNARWVRRPASGEDRETGPTRAPYQLTLRILCLLLQRLAGDIAHRHLSSHRRWDQGTIQITLQPCRKNLLKIDYRRL